MANEPEKQHWWQKFGNIAQIFSLVAAVSAAVLVYNQISANRASTARQMFRTHLELELRHPNFAAPEFDKIKSAGNVELSQYRSFLVHLLYTCEELTIAMDDEPGWHEACRSRLADHPEYLCTKMSKVDLDTYDSRIQVMVKSIGQEASNRVDACKKWASK
jgi:hypothetical protein